jgi:hypothetical protein
MLERLLPILKELASKRMEISVLNIRKYDKEYSEAVDKVVELEDKCELINLKPEEKDLFVRLRKAMDEADIQQSNLSYLAGFADGVLILKALDLLKE